jgi:ABC-type Fe3+ transport system substrate-binding protein
MPWTRRQLLGRVAATGAAALLGACGPSVASTGAPPASGPAKTGAKNEEWEALVEAARREGSVTVYGASGGGEVQDVLTEEFERAIPGISVNGTFISQQQQVARVLAERTAGRFIPDVYVGGTTGMVVSLKQAGAMAPLRPALVLPEVVNPSGWFENQLWFADAEEPYVNLMFVGVVAPLAINTRLVDPSQFSSYWDLLDPKWKGKIVTTDIRQTGPGGVFSRFIYKSPALGPSYLDRLFGEMDVTLSSDQRQIIDWVADGRFSIGMFVSTIEPMTAAKQGLPVTAISVGHFKEGGVIGPENGSVGLADSAPHPNAAQVYINWLLSKEGQMRWQQRVGHASLRTDIGREGVYPPYVPQPGGRYVNGGTEEYSLVTIQAMSDVVNRALSRAGRA